MQLRTQHWRGACCLVSEGRFHKSNPGVFLLASCRRSKWPHKRSVLLSSHGARRPASAIRVSSSCTSAALLLNKKMAMCCEASSIPEFAKSRRISRYAFELLVPQLCRLGRSIAAVGCDMSSDVVFFTTAASSTRSPHSFLGRFAVSSFSLLLEVVATNVVSSHDPNSTVGLCYLVLRNALQEAW